MLPQLFAFVIRNYIWISVLSALGIVWYVAQFVRGQRRIGNAQFRLERERASNERNGALLWVLLLGFVAAASSYINFELRSTVDPSLLTIPTPTLINSALFNVTPTATARPIPRAERPTATIVIAPTATLRSPDAFGLQFPDDVNTPIPTLAVEPLVEGCLGDAIIREPASGITILGGTSLFGKATGDTFAYYRFDVLGPQTGDAWEPLLPDSFSQAVNEGFLASVSLEQWETGIYQIRLSVFAENNTLADSCLIQIGLVN